MEGKNREIIKKLRLLLYESYELIDYKNKFLHAGTLLGSIRGNDIIPYDDDIDLGVYVENINDLENIKNQIRKSAREKNFIVKNIYFGLKLLKYNLGIDIFFYTKTPNGRIEYVTNMPKLIWPNEYFLRSELETFDKGYIGDKQYNIPKNSEIVLERFYGKNWKEYKITHTHELIYENKHIINFDKIFRLIIILFLTLINKNKVSKK